MGKGKRIEWEKERRGRREELGGEEGGERRKFKEGKSRREGGGGGGGGNSTEGKERSNWGKLERAPHWRVEWQLTISLYRMYVHFPYTV